MKSIDFKSFLIGILATTTFFLASGYSSSSGQLPFYSTSVDKNENGTFFYLSNTRTGRTEFFRQDGRGDYKVYYETLLSEAEVQKAFLVSLATDTSQIGSRLCSTKYFLFFRSHFCSCSLQLS